MKDALYVLLLGAKQTIGDYSSLLHLVSAEKRRKIAEFRYDIDKRLSLISDLFVRYLACKALGRPNSALHFGENEYHKPALTGVRGFHYNLSHTRNAIAIGVSGCPVGVDIEGIRPMDLKIAERFFHQHELSNLLKTPNATTQAFLEIWTRKEAYIKWLGMGFSCPLTSFDVTDTTMAKILQTYQVEQYTLSVCSEARLRAITAQVISEAALSEMLSDFAKEYGR